MKEAQIQAKALRWARDNGWLAMKFASPSRRSVPDCLFIRDGRVIFIEFKAPGNMLTNAQIREIARLKTHGAEVHVCHSPEEAKEVLNSRQRRSLRITQAPNEEAKQSAKQLRKALYDSFEDAIDNRWSHLEDRLREALALVVHIRDIEKSYWQENE